MILFEVTTVTLHRWIVGFPTSVEGEPSTMEEARAALDTCIAEGIVLDAKVPRTMGDEFPWRINAAHIVSYQLSDEELVPAKLPPQFCYHLGEWTEVSDPNGPDDRLKFYLCKTCQDTFPLIGDTDQWKPKRMEPEA